MLATTPFPAGIHLCSFPRTCGGRPEKCCKGMTTSSSSPAHAGIDPGAFTLLTGSVRQFQPQLRTFDN